MTGRTPLWMRVAAVSLLALVVINWFVRLIDPIALLLVAAAFVVLGRSRQGKDALAGPRWLVLGTVLLLVVAVLKMLSK